MASRMRWSRSIGLGWLILAAVAVVSIPARGQEPPEPSHRHDLIRRGDRIAWIGSSSTKIGVWPTTVEFLLRTRHPELRAEFARFSTGGGTFETGLEHLDAWLREFAPTLVVFNYGGNDASAGRAGLPHFQDMMRRCVAKVHENGARVVLMTPQAADERKSGFEAAANRALYAESMLNFGRRQGWHVLDVHHCLESLQAAARERENSYSILRDRIHLTEPAYVGWGFLLYDRLELPYVRNSAALRADGEVLATENCRVHDVEHEPGRLAFTRTDRVLPILPPVGLPPRHLVPLEAHSRYLLEVDGLDPGVEYEVRCEGQPVGTTTAARLAAGVNLNSLLLDSGSPAPWRSLAEEFWRGQKLRQISHTSWRFEVRRKPAP